MSFSLDTKIADTILRNISARGFDPKTDIEPELFEHTLSALNSAVDSVFGEVSYQDNDFDFVNELKYNNAVFSAFKTHRQQNDIHAQMWDEQGKVRSFAEFRRATEPILGNYNSLWLQTEYNTAIIRAQFAQKWREMERERDIYPNLQWLPSTSVSPREAHQSLYYKVFAFDDPFLQANYPGSLWGCKCGIKSTNQTPTDKANIKEAKAQTPKSQAGLDCNPATSGRLFSPSHPYLTSCNKKEAKSVALWCDKTLSNQTRTQVRQFFKEKIGATTVHLDHSPVRKISVTYQDVKTITGKPHKYNWAKNNACYFLPEIFKQAEYEGFSSEVKFGKPGHNTSVRWHYYSFILNGEKSFITVQELDNNSYRIHSIQDNDHFKVSKIQKKP